LLRERLHLLLHRRLGRLVGPKRKATAAARGEQRDEEQC
jgi:hypothetical protein